VWASDQAVEAFPDFAYELAFGTEFEQLRRRAAIGRTVGAVRTREHEDVALGINGHAETSPKFMPGGSAENQERNRIEFRAHFVERTRLQALLGARQETTPAPPTPRNT